MSKRLSGGVTAPKGFVASGIHCGIKRTNSLDLALIKSEVPGPVAGVFTKNTLPAAAVVLDRHRLKKRLGQAIVINSGNANAFTGEEGFHHANEMALLTASHLRIPKQYVFVGSTGVIGVPLPMHALRTGIPTLVSQLTKSGYKDAALAIMTTDTRPKSIAVKKMIGGKLVTIGGMAKGSGMIHPNMATMLAYLTTDAVIEPKIFQRMLHTTVDQTFNCISIDGDSSTNDTVLALANGRAGNRTIHSTSPGRQQFQKLLHDVCHSLAMEICRDGEGVTRVVEIRICQAPSNQAAERIAETLATSLLLKTALFGADPNWGRIIAALGRSGYDVRADRLVIQFNQLIIVKEGKGLGPRIEQRAQKVMHQPSFSISVSLGMGKGTARRWTTDLTYEYVKINASYRS